MKRVGALIAALLLAGCGGSPEPPAPVADERIESTLSLARFAFREGRYDRAEEIYGRALERARERDDIDSIALVSFELSATRLRLGDAPGALATAERAAAEVERRDAPASARLALAMAAAELALDHPEAARRLAAEAASGASDERVRARATYIDGRGAAEMGDRAGLDAAIAALSTDGEEPSGDFAELGARAAALDGDCEAARAGFMETAEIRRDARDYRAMAEALAGAARASDRLGDEAAAADAWLRAGRSAAAQGDSDAAREWLDLAVLHGERVGAAEIAEEAEEIGASLD